MIERFFTTGHKIQRVTVSQDAYGGTTESWADHLTVAGKLWQLNETERLSADKETAFSTHKFVTALADITETDRYLDPDGNAYDIKGPPAERKRPDGTGHLELSLEKVS